MDAQMSKQEHQEYREQIAFENWQVDQHLRQHDFFIWFDANKNKLDAFYSDECNNRAKDASITVEMFIQHEIRKTQPQSASDTFF